MNRLFDQLLRISLFLLAAPILIGVIYSGFSKNVGAQACPTGSTSIQVEKGLISAKNTTGLSAGSEVLCVSGNQATIPQFSIQTYDEMKSLYYNQAKTGISKTKLTGDQTQSAPNSPINLAAGSGDKLYWITKGLPPNDTNNLTINSDITVPKTGVIFVDGNLFINSDLKSSANNTGLVFVVNGTINIAPSVVQIDAFLIAFTGFCSAYQGIGNCNDVNTNQQQLKINGSLIFLNQTPGTKPNFVRQKATATQAAETLTYQPKYLVILKDIFSRDLKIWREIQ